MKKVIYILNLLFLTLSVFGGSVFAADPPTQYIDADGSVEDVPRTAVDLNTVEATTTGSYVNYQLTDQNWYYIDGTVTKTDHYLYVESGDNVNIVVVGNQTLNLGKFALFVPDNGSINFWAASNNGTDNGVSLEISNSGSPYSSDINFVIGNNASGQEVFQYTSSDFGDITFNSGSYTIKNSAKGNVAIGSNTTSGGTITVNQAATVSAWNDWNSGSPGVVVGVGDSSQNCTIQVNGGLL